MYEGKKIEEEVVEFWKKNKIYQKVKDKNKGKKPFYFLQGPPYTSGRLHIGQAWNNSLKDSLLRFKRMNNFDVWDRAGYDMHGLPTSSKVQKNLGLSTKEDIIKFGLDKFAKECMNFSLNHVKTMNEDLFNLGVWMDYDNAYMPIDDEWIESVWWLIKKSHEKNRLYEGLKTITWCKTCETALAKHECEYKNIVDNSIFVRFKIKGTKNEYLLVWTTTPWTIALNLGVMVHPDFTYIKVKVDNDVYIIAKNLADKVIKGVLKKDYTILEEIKGKNLEGLEYIHPMEKDIKEFKILKAKYPKIHTVLLSNIYVTLDTGTGLVHTAPGCGPEDYEVGYDNNIPPFNPINELGIFPKDFGELSGWVAKKDDNKFIKKMVEDEVIIGKQKIEHDYAHCERCHNPVIFRATKQWFFKIEDLKERMLKLNKKIYWIPESINNSYISWLQNLRDNSITKQRFWGTPLPIWRCNNCNEYKIIDTKKEIINLSGKDIKNLHRPWIDEVELNCQCGGKMKRIPDILDVWLDSGVASFACLYYPQKKELFEKLFPPDFILEGRDQVRGWFNLLMVVSTMVFNKVPSRVIYAHGMVTDIDGVKMSKSLGNVISPYEIIDKYSADTFRFYMNGVKVGEDINFSWEEVKQKYRTLSILWNIHQYLINYCKALNIDPREMQEPELEEKYILSRLSKTIKKVTEFYEFYKLDDVPLEIENLFLELSREYIQSVREKVNKNPKLVLSTIFKVLFETIKILSTIAPFITEKIYQNLKKEFGLEKESIHLFDWPKVDKKYIDEKLESNFLIAKQIIQSGLSAREKSQIGLRWPLNEIIIVSRSEEVEKAIKELKSFILYRLNVKNIRLEKENKLFKTILSPNKSEIGKDFKKDSSLIIDKLNDSVMKDLVKDGFAFVDKFRLITKHINIKETIPDNLKVSEFKFGNVIIDTNLTKEVEIEGYVREVIRRLQDFRKEKGLKKQDKVNISISCDLNLSNWSKLIKDRVGIEKLTFDEKNYQYNIEFKIKEHNFIISFGILTT